jgi:hypothetical protein
MSHLKGRLSFKNIIILPAMKLKLLYPLAVVLLLISCNTTPDSEIQSHPGISVYPNPATDFISVMVQSSNDGGSVSIIDSNGDEFFSEPLNIDNRAFEVPLQGKPEGVFHVMVKQNNKSYTIEFLHL